jgi:hypothetical protein
MTPFPGLRLKETKAKTNNARKSPVAAAMPMPIAAPVERLDPWCEIEDGVGDAVIALDDAVPVVGEVVIAVLSRVGSAVV